MTTACLQFTGWPRPVFWDHECKPSADARGGGREGNSFSGGHLSLRLRIVVIVAPAGLLGIFVPYAEWVM